MSMSKTTSSGILILSLVIVLSGAVLPASAISSIPNRFTGEVILNGTGAPAGTTIEAFIDGELRGSIVVESPGRYEHLSVTGSDSDDDDNAVTFTVGGLTANQTGTWVAMRDSAQILKLVAGVDAQAGDTTYPEIAITAPIPDAPFTTADITVSGTASDESLDKVQVRVGPSGNWIDATGNTSWSTTVTLEPGSNTIYARANDTSENSKKVQVDVSYLVGGSKDTTPPTVSIDSPSDGDAFTTTTITVSGTADDDEGVSRVRVKAGSGDWIDATGNTSWSRTITMSYGVHKIEVRAFDDTGNPSETASITVARNPPGSRPTPTGMDTQPVSGNIDSATPTSTITTTDTSATNSTKKPATKPETEELPGFEVVFAIAGLLAIAYLRRNRV